MREQDGVQKARGDVEERGDRAGERTRGPGRDREQRDTGMRGEVQKAEEEGRGGIEKGDQQPRSREQDQVAGSW